ncbi:hypothetical protein SAMD00023353_4400330 [Rosellinia necatrix]|uniref:Zn(2)-C6 fungal-type domain-containing protein n=1 Tax=Rosellinia necatrix TaxID=77044 RepID=A0A1W2TNH6_ROSNE|nr:hypothetical protein SAMD00023353_4400330 [Rosellinia necatrix]
MSSHNNSPAPLMGFSVHQPTVGAPLQFFPAMGSKQLDEMINAYIPGDISILDKRAAVSMEFFQYSMATGDLFKFFMVYPTLSSANPSPIMDSGCYSSFSTSPAMSDSQWANSTSQIASPSFSKKSTSASDFSNLPGMKIMTKDGRDVTNSASRGCKTKEQRDHAHLMRIIKACDSCRRKKTKCDPSHKKGSAGTSSGKVTKKTNRNPRPAAAPPQIASRQISTTPEFDQLLSGSSSSLDSLLVESLNTPPTDSFSMDWDQFIQFDEEPTNAIPYDYNILLDPAGYFSPAAVSFSSSSTSPSQLPITPIDQDVNITDDTTIHDAHKPLLPYLHPGGAEPGSNYVDFNLYSPQSSFLDEELGWANEVAASPIRPRGLNTQQEFVSNTAASGFNDNAIGHELADSRPQGVTSTIARDRTLHHACDHAQQWPRSPLVRGIVNNDRELLRESDNPSLHQQAASGSAGTNKALAAWPTPHVVFEGITPEGLYGRNAIGEHGLSTPLPGRVRLARDRPNPTSAVPTTRNALAGLSQEEEVNHGCALSHSTSRDAATRTQSSIARSCGQDEPTSAERGVMDLVARSFATQATGRLGDQPDNIQNSPGTSAILHSVVVYRAPGVETSLPSASRKMAIPPWNIRPSSSGLRNPHMRSSTEQRMTQTPAVINAGRALVEPNHTSAVEQNFGCESQYPAGERQSLSGGTSLLAASDILPTISAVAGLILLSLVMRPTSTTPAAASKSLIKETRSVVPGCATRSMLLSLSLVLYQQWPVVTFVAISIMSIVTYLLRLALHTASITKAESTIPPLSNKLLCVELFHTDAIQLWMTSSTKALRLVRCDLPRRLKAWTRPQIPSVSGSSLRRPSRGLERQAVIPFV